MPVFRQLLRQLTFVAADAIQGYTDNCAGAVTATLTNTSVQAMTVPGQ